MKKIKITAALAAVFTAMNCMTSYVSGEEYCETLKYVVKDENVVITGYKGEPEVLDIPARIDGRDVVQIRENAFYKCESLKKITLPDTVINVGHHAFFECFSLESVVMEGDIYSIETGCFSGCINLMEIKLPDKLRMIDDKSFYNCINLEKINLPSDLEEIGNYAFSGCMFKTVELSDELLNIGEGAFSDCKNMSRIFIPDSVINIGSCAFGYNGKPLKKSVNFIISGSDSSLGKKYAQSNGIEYDNLTTEKTKGKLSMLPALSVIFSGVGLLFFNFFEKVRFFKSKYEYEC